MVTEQPTPEEFFKMIDDIVWECDCSYMDALLLFAERNDMEVETVAAQVKKCPTLKALISIEGENLNMVEKTNRLEF